MEETNRIDRINAIWKHPLFVREYKALKELEADRIFCRHGLDHLLDVARVAYIFALEAGVKIERELVYAAALLHDIGRAEQYRGGRKHEEAGADFAGQILADCSFNSRETEEVVACILQHRDYGWEKTLQGFIQRADKLTRCCMECPAKKACKWPDERKNMVIRY